MDTRSGSGHELGPRAVTYPYRRIERVEATPSDGPDPYGEPDPAWLRIDWSEHLRSVEAGDTRVDCAEIGEGPPILFVHGLGGCWQNWLENMPALAELGHRAIAVDLPGFGSSPMPPWEISIPAYGRFLDAFCPRAGNRGVRPGRQLDGRLRRRRGGDRRPRAASSGSCSSPRPASATRRCAASR